MSIHGVRDSRNGGLRKAARVQHVLSHPGAGEWKRNRVIVLGGVERHRQLRNRRIYIVEMKDAGPLRNCV